MNDDDLRPGLKRDARTNGECFVNFDGDDFALRAGQFGKDGGVVAGAATKMKKAVAGVDVKQAEVEGPEAGLAIVQALGRVENNESVAIDIARIVAFSEQLRA